MGFSNVRAAALAVLAASALLLSGCFVTSQNRVEGKGPDADPQLLGTWLGLDEDGKAQKNVFLHVLPHKSGKGFGMAFLQAESLMILEGTTVQAGPNRYLNAKLAESPSLSDDDGEMAGIHIVRYEVKGNKLSLWLLDVSEIANAISAGKLKGLVEGSGATRTVKLSSSSKELTAFLATANASQYFQDTGATFVRFEN